MGCIISVNTFDVSDIMFISNWLAFLKGSALIIPIIVELSPSIGNHIPLKIDCATITIDEMPPIDFSLHKEPNKIPKPICWICKQIRSGFK